MFVCFIFLALCCFITSEGSVTSCDYWPSFKNFHLIHSEDDCGRAKNNGGVSTRIYNGTTVAPGSLPWVAFLQIKLGGKIYICGGTIINENYIITAAHCVEDPQSEITIALGIHDHWDHWDHVYTIKEKIFYPQYSSASAKFDLALLRLDRKISFDSPLVNYICLPTPCDVARPSYQGVNLTVVGWGRQSNGKTSDTLQSIQMEGSPCRPYGYKNITETPVKKQMCAKSPYGLPCAGDSGGPLLWYDVNRKRYFLIGVTATGPLTCTLSPNKNIYIFTRVPPVIGWILKTIKP